MKKWLLVFASLFIFPTLCLAHRISVFAYQEGSQIHVEGFFSDGTPTKQARVDVYGEKGKKIFSKQTNEKGALTFNAPKNQKKLKIVLTASMGHRAETTFELNQKDQSTSPTHEDSESPKPATQLAKVQGISERTLRSIVREEVNRATQPIMKTLARQEAEKVSFRDIVGGIGWIMGLMGIWMMMKSRKK